MIPEEESILFETLKKNAAILKGKCYKLK